MTPLRVFIGYDPRQPLAYSVLQHSIVRHASVPVSITPLILSQLPIQRRGLTEFTYSRFLTPWLCGFKGQALFLDADMVVTGDIAELFKLAGMNAVSVVQTQPRFEWASAMLFNCASCLQLTPAFVNDAKNSLFDLGWAPYVGELPGEWNSCVGYVDTPDDVRLLHYTQGLPCFFETRGRPEDAAWDEEKRAMLQTVGWRELMGTSVHAEPVLRRMLGRYKC